MYEIILSWLINNVETLVGWLINIGAFLLILGILVIVHEFGHFWVARRCGVKVEEFAFGLPPRLWAFKKGATEYAINAIPFGGYVKMLGQDDFDPKAGVSTLTPEHFEAKTWWQKALILCAGVGMNIILAILLLSVGYMIGMKPILQESPLFTQALQRGGVVIHEIHTNSLGEQLGIPVDGELRAINDIKVTSTSQLHTLIAENRAKGFSLTVNDNLYNIPPLREGELIGMGYGENLIVTPIQLPPHKALYYAAWDSALILRETFVSFGELIGGIFTRMEVSQDVTGPIGIFKITSEVSRNGFVPFLQLIALLSLSLAAINIVPFPALDGGRLLFVLLEAVFPKKWNKLLEGKVHLIGMLFLLLFMIAITYKDILKLFM